MSRLWRTYGIRGKVAALRVLEILSGTKTQLKSKMPKPAHPDVAKVAEVILIRAVEGGHMAPGLYITVK